ncbi:MAG: DEAD/DEAH box helicase [Opitutaceae bacterium]|jgi:superfamily II DNA or RNA helicase|nr:DEAD/DEAH box helicase [Opitutaceae bacterium]
MPFSPGNIVNARSREWIVLPDSTEDFVRVRPIGGSDEESTGILTAIEPVVSAEFAAPDPDKPGDYRSSRLLRDAARLGVRTTAGPFRCFASIEVEPRPYQLVPLLMALRQEPVRLLIADDVGIGKTIEASLIAREFRDRGEIQRLAVLCPPHLAEQWQAELREKFHLEATLVLPGTAVRLERDLPPDRQSIFEHYPVVVVSLDYIKSEKRRHDFLRTCPEFVIVDEAHTCSAAGEGRGSRHQRFELISGLAAKPDQHLILVSATPHSGNEAAFRGLLGLLRPEFADLPSDLSGEHHRSLREKLAAHIVQRRRADIRAYLDQNTSFPDRLETEATYELSPAYRALFEKVLAYAREIVTDPAGTHRQRVQWWSVLALLRALASSPAAASATLRARASVADTATAAEADDLGSLLVLDLEQADSANTDIDPGADTSAPAESGDTPDSTLLSRSRLLALAKEADRLANPRDDAKLARALDLVASLLKEGGKPIVFCRFIATADYVARALREKLGSKYNIEAVTGVLPSDERKLRVEELSEKPNRVLVCTDCLSEGINLQRGFDAVIHYDLSWNPTRHEQREGRVDRYGQQSTQVKVVTYYGADNGIDGIVLDVLLRKHQAIRRSLGISVPIPVNTDQVINAVMEGLILRGHKPDATALLPGFEEIIAPQRDLLAREWINASEREKKSRSLFAQNAIKVEDVAREVEAMRATLGSRLDVQEFLETSLERYGAVRLGGIHGRTGRYDLSPVPVPVREAMSLSADTRQLAYSFEPSLSEGDGASCRFLTRTHPIPAGLAAYVVDTALDPLLPSIASRAGAMVTRAVERRTTVLILRPRYRLLTRRGHATAHETLAEDCFTAAFAGSPSAPEWLDAAALDGLLLAQPAGNILPELARERLRTVVDALPDLIAQLDPLIAARAAGFAEANRRVRTAIRERGWTFEVTPLPRPDILGLYVLLPAAPTA